MSRTVVSIEGDSFCLDGEPLYAGRKWRGVSIEGLLMNARLVQGVFDDRNAETRDHWDTPDRRWDPERNTREFITAMPAWKAQGLAGFTINFQGGSPQGYSKAQPWENSAYEPDGTLREPYLDRMGRILDRADELGMAVILGLFYFGQDERLADENAVLNATDNAVDWLLGRGDRHVLVEICNETDVPRYEHELLTPPRVAELVRRVQQRSDGKVDSPAGRLLASVSMCGGSVPTDEIVAAADFLLLHGNGVGADHFHSDPDRIREMVAACRARNAYRGQPIVFNEDDHWDFDAPDNNMTAAVASRAGWGYFDYRLQGEGLAEGYQSVPTDWSISSARKRAFFDLLKAITGAEG